MSKTSIFLLLLLFLSIGAYFYFSASLQNVPLSQRFTVKAPAHTPSSARLSFSQLKTNDGLTLALHIDDKTIKATLIQLEIGYDPTVLDIEKIQPGQYFTTPPTIFKNVNEHLGRITYALSCDQTSQKTCQQAVDQTLVYITFSPHLPMTTLTTTVELLPKTYLKTSQGQQVTVKKNNIILTLEKAEKVASDAATLPQQIKQ